jgi:hypothetical protein
MANVATIEIRAQDKTTTAFRKVNSGLTKLDQKLNQTKGKMGMLNGGLGKMAGLMGGVIGVAAITGFAKNLLTTADRLQKVGLQLGISVEKLQAYQFAAGQTGVNTEAMNSALKKFNINIGKAGEGFGEQVKGFENLGIAIYDTNGNLRDSPAIFEDVADKIALMESPAQKAEAAVALFGKAGVDLLPLLNLGSAGVRDFEKTLVNAGGVIGQDAADDISTFNDKIDLMGKVLTANLAPILVAILPALTLLAENIDLVAGAAGVLAGVFIATKLWTFIGTITAAITAMNVAMLLNPFVLVATGIAAAGVVAFTYKDDMSDWFSFAEDGEENLKGVNKELPKLGKVQKEIAKIEGTRLKVAEKFVKTSKKDIIPNLKKLEEGLGATKIEFVNLAGREGLGGIQLAFRSFFMDVWGDATFYLGGTSATIKKNFTNMETDFEEFFKALDNIVLFEGNDVKNAMTDVMDDLVTEVKALNTISLKFRSFFMTVLGDAKFYLEKTSLKAKTEFGKIFDALEAEVKAVDISFNTTSVEVPKTIFDFTNTVVDVPGDIFGTAAKAEAKLVSLVARINSYSASSRTVGRTAVAGSYQMGEDRSTYWNKPFWEDEVPQGVRVWNANELKYQVPSITEGARSQNAPSQMSSPASRNASRGGGGSGVVVNIYDGTGQKISAYDSEIRVQITERASRNSEFAALE